MCHRHHPVTTASATWSRKRRHHYPNGCRHRRCAYTTRIQSSLTPTTLNRPATAPVTSRAALQEFSIPQDDVPLSNNPPPYTEVRTTDHIELPEAAKRYSQIYFEKSVPLHSLGKEPGYIMV